MVILPIEEAVPIWLLVTTTAQPLPVEPATVLVMTTLPPDCTAEYSGEETLVTIEFVINPATSLGVDPAGTVIGPVTTDTPLTVMFWIVPPAALIELTLMLPSFDAALQ